MKTFNILLLLLTCCICGMTATPDAPVNMYKVRDDDKNVCLLAQFALTFDVTYESLTDPNAKARFIVPIQAEVNKELSYCHSTNPRLVVEFYDGYNLTITYDRGEDAYGIDQFSFGIWTLGYTLDNNRFPDAAYPGSTVVVTNERFNGRTYNKVVGMSYRCLSKVPVEFPEFTVTLLDTHVQPFEVENGKYAPALHCRNDAALEAPVMNYELYADDNNICVLAQFALAFHIKYDTLTLPYDVVIYFVVPEDATVNRELSSCSDTFAKLVIEFYEGYNFTSTFELVDGVYTFADWTLGYTLDEERFPDAVDPGSTVLSTFGINWSLANVGESFRCETISVIGKFADLFASVLRDTHVQPFAVENGTYGPATSCHKDDIIA